MRAVSCEQAKIAEETGGVEWSYYQQLEDQSCFSNETEIEFAPLFSMESKLMTTYANTENLAENGLSRAIVMINRQPITNTVLNKKIVEVSRMNITFDDRVLPVPYLTGPTEFTSYDFNQFDSFV